MDSVLRLSAHQQLQKIHSRELSCHELCSAYLKKIELLNPKYNALISVNQDAALKMARAVDEKVAGKKPLRTLEGLPIILKDIICTKGVLQQLQPLRCLENFVPTYSATVWKRLEDAGAILLGKANQDEFAMGQSNENSYFGACKNPWNPDFVAGGSSGGSAACVGLQMAPVSLGSDTGGSIRQPAHFCGVFGIKPTYGRVSRSGVIAFASSLDQIGSFSRYVKDSALILKTISGKDPLDSTMSAKPVPSWFKSTKDNVKGLKIACIKDFLSQSNKDIQSAFKHTQGILEEGGASLEFVDVHFLDVILAIYYFISSAEASSNLARYDGARYGHRSSKASKNVHEFFSYNRGEGFGAEVKRRIFIGTLSLSHGYADDYYNKARKFRSLIRQQVNDIFKSYDLILSPVCATTAFPIGQKRSIEEDYTSDLCTVIANLCGIPAASVPVGLSSEGLPVGLQFMAPHFEEQRLFDVALYLENQLQFYKKEPHGL